MTKINRFSPAFGKGHFYGLVDEGEYLRQSSLYKQILPRPVRRSFSEGGTPSWQIRSLPAYQLSLWSLPTYQVGPRKLFTPLETCLLFLMGRNPRSMNDLRLRKITYEKIKLFLQNEPNFRKSQMNLTALLTREYVQMDTWSIGKNKPKTNPIQSQYKANSKPKQSQNKAKTNPISKAKQC